MISGKALIGFPKLKLESLGCHLWLIPWSDKRRCRQMAAKSRWWQRLRRQAWQALAEGVKAAATCRECHQMSELVCRGRRRLWPWPAFFLSLNSVGIRQIGLLMSFVCCQPEWSVGSGSLGPNWKSKRVVCGWSTSPPGWAAPHQAPLLPHFVWQRLTACPELCLCCQTKVLPLRNVHKPDDASPSPGMRLPLPTCCCCYEGTTSTCRELLIVYSTCSLL